MVINVWRATSYDINIWSLHQKDLSEVEGILKAGKEND